MPRTVMFVPFLAAFFLLLAGCTEEAPAMDGHIGYQEQAIHSVCLTAGSPRSYGIDVSKWQGTIDWAQVGTSGKTFAIIRASSGGTYKDTTFAANWAGAKSAGLLRGAYHYFLADVSGTTQADLMVSVMGTLGVDDLPPVIDVEETRSQTAATIVTRVNEMVVRLRELTGRDAMIYSGGYFWDTNVKSTQFASLPLWTAHYFNDGTTSHCPNTPDAWSKWTLWQYSSTGSVPGITGNVDLDVFEGTRDDLLALAHASQYYKASFVAQSFPYASQGPLVLALGETRSVSIDLKNTGTATWDSNTRLAFSQPRDGTFPGLQAASWLSPTRLVAVSGTVPPGSTYRFQFELTGSAPGTYDVFFNLVQEGSAWFSDPGQGGPTDHQLEGIFTVDPNADGGTAAPPDAGLVDDGGVIDGDGGTVDGDGGVAAPSHRQGGCSAAAGPGGAPIGAMLVILAALVAGRRRRGRG